MEGRYITVVWTVRVRRAFEMSFKASSLIRKCAAIGDSVFYHLYKLCSTIISVALTQLVPVTGHFADYAKVAQDKCGL